MYNVYEYYSSAMFVYFNRFLFKNIFLFPLLYFILLPFFHFRPFFSLLPFSPHSLPIRFPFFFSTPFSFSIPLFLPISLFFPIPLSLPTLLSFLFLLYLPSRPTLNELKYVILHTPITTPKHTKAINSFPFPIISKSAHHS